MSGRGSEAGVGAGECDGLLADADVLIDYREFDLEMDIKNGGRT